MTYISAVGRRIRLGDEPLGPCSASLGWDCLVPAPCSWAEGLTSLALGGAAAEPSPSLASTSGTAADPPAPTCSEDGPMVQPASTILTDSLPPA